EEGAQDVLEEDRRRLEQLDRSVYTLHLALAEQQGKLDEYQQRYAAHLRLQALEQATWEQSNQVEGVLRFLASRPVVQVEELVGAVGAVRQARDVMAEVYRQAGELCLPPLKHLPAGQPLACYLPAEPTLPEIRVARGVEVAWIQSFHRQVLAALDR